MATTLQEQRVQLGAITRERDGAEKRVADLKTELDEAKAADHKERAAWLEVELGRAQRVLDKAKDELKTVGQDVRTRAKRYEER